LEKSSNRVWLAPTSGRVPTGVQLSRLPDEIAKLLEQRFASTTMRSQVLIACAAGLAGEQQTAQLREP